MYGSWTTLVFISGTLMAQRHLDLVVELVLRPFLQSVPGVFFQQDMAVEECRFVMPLRGCSYHISDLRLEYTPGKTPSVHLSISIGLHLQWDTIGNVSHYMPIQWDMPLPYDFPSMHTKRRLLSLYFEKTNC